MSLFYHIPNSGVRALSIPSLCQLCFRNVLSSSQTDFQIKNPSEIKKFERIELARLRARNEVV